MDRICLIKMNYQSAEEEQDIVRVRTGSNDAELINLAVKMVRETRDHPDIKLGASVRAGIDLVDLFVGMQKLTDQPQQNFLTSAWMSMSNKIWLKEMASKSADEIIEKLWHCLRDEGKICFDDKENRITEAMAEQEVEDKDSDEAIEAKKKKMIAM
jgi:MoxR-like ATPase